ncbi:MAG: hypothetical protein GDA36_03495 [Rhodobacteraceae bacterium]|nr:hypothetical protein [Paracoccaceae bacterium]
MTISFGYTGGQHRSVMMAQAMTMALAEGGSNMSIGHRELEHRTGG